MPKVRKMARDRLVFREDEAGGVHSALRGLQGHSVLLREPWWRGTDFQLALAAGIDLLILWPLVHRPFWRLRRWWVEARSGGWLGASRWLSASIRATGVAFVLCLGIGLTIFATTTSVEEHATLFVAAGLPYLLGGLSLAGVAMGAVLWRRGIGTLKSRIGFSGLVAGGLALTAWAEYWNVLSTRL